MNASIGIGQSTRNQYFSLTHVNYLLVSIVLDLDSLIGMLRFCRLLPTLLYLLDLLRSYQISIRFRSFRSLLYLRRIRGTSSHLVYHPNWCLRECHLQVGLAPPRR